jgi:hypothetical protein
MFANLGLKRLLFAVWNDDGADLAATFHNAKYGSLGLAASASDAAFALRDMHVTRFAANKSLIGIKIPFHRNQVFGVGQVPNGMYVARKSGDERNHEVVPNRSFPF